MAPILSTLKECDGWTPKIKDEVLNTGKLNPAYIPILQNISPGEIQHFSRTLVTKWLKTYKFKYWDVRSTSGEKVTDKYKEQRAKEIATKLCKHADWLTHGRSIRISDLEQMKLQITDYSKDRKLSEAIDRYYTLLRMTFDMTGIYKIFETCDSHMNISVYPGNDYTIIFDKMKQYNDDNSLTDADFLKSEEIIANDEIRDFIQICKELNDSSQGCVYDTFS